MSTAAEAQFLVLHGVRLKGTAQLEGLAELIGAAPAEVADSLATMAAAGLVRHYDGALNGWVTTPAGRAAQERWLAGELDEVGGRAAVDGVYRRFGSLNRRLLAAVTDWQLRDGALNRHDDPVWDAGVVARLAGIDAEAQAPLGDLEAVLDRFGWHRPRLSTALARVRSGEGDWVDRPGIDSYHTVWFQLHEDLLNTLGRQRSDES
jgi:hypothetical protein